MTTVAGTRWLATGALLGALAAITASGCAHAGAAGHGAPTVAVTATGRTTASPDMALVTLGAEARAATLAQATAEVARRMTAVLARARALGIPEADIATAAYSVEPVMTPPRTGEEPMQITGYRASSLVRLTLRQLDGIGRALDDLVSAGANAVRGVQFALADPGRAEARARENAVREATARAEQLAAAAGRRLGALIWLGEGAMARPWPDQFLRTTQMAIPAMAPGPVEPGQLEIAVTVDARWRLAP